MRLSDFADRDGGWDEDERVQDVARAIDLWSGEGCACKPQGSDCPTCISKDAARALVSLLTEALESRDAWRKLVGELAAWRGLAYWPWLRRIAINLEAIEAVQPRWPFRGPPAAREEK